MSQALPLKHLTLPTWIPWNNNLTMTLHLRHYSPRPPPPLDSLPFMVELRIFPGLDWTSKSPCFYIPLMLSCPHPMSILFWIKPRTKYCYCSQCWRNKSTLFSDNWIAQRRLCSPLILNKNLILFLASREHWTRIVSLRTRSHNHCTAFICYAKILKFSKIFLRTYWLETFHFPQIQLSSPRAAPSPNRTKTNRDGLNLININVNWF